MNSARDHRRLQHEAHAKAATSITTR